MWNFCKTAGGVALIGGGIIFAIWGIGYGILTVEHNVIDYKAKVEMDTYATKFEVYVTVCQGAGIPASVCVLAWPNGVRK